MDDDTASLTAALVGFDGFGALPRQRSAASSSCWWRRPRTWSVARGVGRWRGRRTGGPSGAGPADRGRPVVLCWGKRVWCCPHPLCETKTWTEQHEAIAPRACLTERARQWAFEQVGDRTGPSPGSRAARVAW